MERTVKRVAFMGLFLLSFLSLSTHAGRLIDERTVKRPMTGGIGTIVVGGKETAATQFASMNPSIVTILDAHHQGNTRRSDRDTVSCDAGGSVGADDIIRILFEECAK